LGNLPSEASGNRLGKFEHATGNLPCAGVAALDDQDVPIVVGDDGGDAHRVLAHACSSSKMQAATVASSCRLYRSRPCSSGSLCWNARTRLTSSAGPAVVTRSNRSGQEYSP